MKFNSPDSGGIKLITLNPNHKYFDPAGVVQKTKDVRPRWGRLISTSPEQSCTIPMESN